MGTAAKAGDTEVNERPRRTPAAQEERPKTSSRKEERGNPATRRKSCGISSPAWRGSPWPVAQPAPFLPAAPPRRFEAGGNLVRNHTDPVGFSTSASCTGEGAGSIP